MGNRRRWVALGATFALLVAACAAPTSSEISSDAAVDGVSSPATPGSSALAARDGALLQESTTLQNNTGLQDNAEIRDVTESLADASFLRPANQGTCTDSHAALTIFDPVTGELRATVPIPAPATSSIVSGNTAHIAFTWDRDQRPGIGAVDLEDAAPMWQRFLDSVPEELTIINGSLIVVSRDDIRALDAETGDDLWVLDSQFDLDSIVVGTNAIFALDQVGVHAINAITGEVAWQLPIDRPDTLAANDEILAVASRTRVMAVDIAAQRRLFDIDVDRSGSGRIWVSSQSVIHDLSTTVAPGGGIAAINARTGVEQWRDTSIGETVFAGTNVLVASTVNAEPNPGTPFVLFGVNADTGERIWETYSTAQVFDAVLGSTDNRVAIIQPHQVLAGLSTVRLLNSATGQALWQASTDLQVDGASIEIADLVSLYGASPRIGTDRGAVAMRGVGSQWWAASTPEGIMTPPTLSISGLVAIAGDNLSGCVGRSVGEPTVVASTNE